MNKVSWYLRFWCVSALWLGLACQAPDDKDLIGALSQPIAGQFDGIDWSIDAPWRLEPPYGKVPITVTFHDIAANVPGLGQFCGLRIAEIADSESTTVVSHISPGEFHELESRAAWTPDSEAPVNRDGGEYFHRLVRRWKGEALGNITTLGDTSEWNGTYLYAPRKAGVAGTDLRLQVTAFVESFGRPCPRLDYYHMDNLDGRMEEVNGPSGTHLYVNVLQVRYGNALPRFDANWVYGDLHYHSEGTDNEGEAGTSYRAAIQSMKALGLDFLFATEHASDSVQMTGLGEAFITDLPDFDLPFWSHIEEHVLDLLNPVPTLEFGERRDMDLQRFTILHDVLNAPDGVNQQVLSDGTRRTPQIFLGGEVDVIPELSQAEASSGDIAYGNRKFYDWQLACYLSFRGFAANCGNPSELLVETGEPGRHKLLDMQGPLWTTFYSRQHLVHLPFDPGRSDAFVSSHTSHFGGAQRRLKDVLCQDYVLGGAQQKPPFTECVPETAARPSKGYAFLAHPVAAASGVDLGRLGPDIVPYSEIQLKTAFDSEYVLGLQLWNEDERAYTELGPLPALGRFPMRTVNPGIDFGATFFPSLWSWSEKRDDSQRGSLHNGAATWDKMLLWGVDPSKRPAWVPAGEPRKVLMAGGSDAHGDLNYRRLGYMVGWIAAVDTAIGKPRNLVNVGPTRPKSLTGVSGTLGATIDQTQVVDALRSGEFSITDGPALRIAIDQNQDGLIGTTDVPMGGFLANARTSLRLVVEWKSTDEFGPVTSIDLYVGAHASGHAGVVYAPLNHGVRSIKDPSGGLSLSYIDTAGKSHSTLRDGYLLDPTPGGVLRINPANLLSITERFDPVKVRKIQMSGRAVVILNRADFPVWERRCVTTTEIVREGYVDDFGRYIKPVVATRTKCTAEDLDSAERIYVRGFARSSSSLAVAGNLKPGILLERYAFSNPVWASFSTLLFSLPVKL
jgi:hypothetical protein